MLLTSASDRLQAIYAARRIHVLAPGGLTDLPPVSDAARRQPRRGWDDRRYDYCSSTLAVLLAMYLERRINLEEPNDHQLLIRGVRDRQDTNQFSER